jgi:hypothetical protein
VLGRYLGGQLPNLCSIHAKLLERYPFELIEKIPLHKL